MCSKTNALKVKNNLKKAIIIIFFILLFLPIFSIKADYNFKESSGLKTIGDETGQSGGKIDKPETIIATVIEVALSFVGIFFLILMIYGGYTRMTARGSSEEVTKSNNIIKVAIIGLIIVISAYAVSSFVLRNLTGQTLTADVEENE